MKRYTALGWVVWKIMGRVVRRKAARNRARLTALGVIVGVVGAGIAAARAKRGD
jgi:hypothetical protein